jgi:hypothetical protein
MWNEIVHHLFSIQDNENITKIVTKFIIISDFFHCFVFFSLTNAKQILLFPEQYLGILLENQTKHKTKQLNS